MTWTKYQTKYGCGAIIESDKGLYAHILPAYTEDEIERMVFDHYDNPILRGSKAAHSLTEYFEGRRADFDLVFDLCDAAAFERAVYHALSEVPYGRTITYGQLADAAGYPGAARAVGNAMAKNRLPVLIPCHRVVHASGALKGWSGLRGWKERLLSLESRVSSDS
ncbi:MAG: methylated-DNA--[protein]-cysteine S-methyltransferase [Candidatus Aquicultorales bacterium]